MSSREQVRLWHPLRGLEMARHGLAAPTSAEVADLERAAYEKGYSAASALVSRQILEQRQEINQVCETLFRSLEDGVASAVAQVRSALPSLTMQALRRVLARVEVTGEIVVSVVEELLTEIGPDVGPVELRLHPADLEYVQDLEPQLARNHPGLRFVADEGLRRGDCQAATRFGKVDARLENKLEKLEASLVAG